jgi:aryl-alcohol dehydrogenase-like predicted oxidoreductase
MSQAEATMVERGPLGSTGITVSVLGMGCSQLGSVWHGKSDKESRAAVAAALDRGITFFDTADCYGLGRSERLLGDVVRRMGKRSDVVIATKCGLLKTPSAALRAIRSSVTARNASTERRRVRATVRRSKRALATRSEYAPRYIERSVEASLRRLRTDYLDVFFLHSPPRDLIATDRIRDVFHKLKAEGKIRASGLSLRSGDDAAGRMGGLAVDCIEFEVNLCASRRAGTSALLSEAANAGVGVVGRQPFGSGALFEGSGEDATTVRRASLQSVLMDQRVSVVIPGMTSEAHVRQNVSDALAESLPPELIDDVRRRICESREVIR